VGATYLYYPARFPGYPVNRQDCYQEGWSDSGFRDGVYYSCAKSSCHMGEYSLGSMDSGGWYCGYCVYTYRSGNSFWPGGNEVTKNPRGNGVARHNTHPRAYLRGREMDTCDSRNQWNDPTTGRWKTYQDNVAGILDVLQTGLDSVYGVLLTCGPYDDGGAFTKDGDSGGRPRIYLNFTVNEGDSRTISKPSTYGGATGYQALEPGTLQNPDGKRDSGGAPYSVVTIDAKKGRSWSPGSFGETANVSATAGHANTWTENADPAPYKGDCLQSGAQKFTDASNLIGKAVLPAGWHGDAADSYNQLATTLLEAAKQVAATDNAVRQQVLLNATNLAALQSSLHTQILACNDALPSCLSLAQTDFNLCPNQAGQSDGSTGYKSATSTATAATTVALQSQATYIDAMTSSAYEVSTDLSGQYETARNDADSVSQGCDSDFSTELVLENITDPGTSSSWMAVAASGGGSAGRDFQTGWSTASSVGALSSELGGEGSTGGAGSTGAAGGEGSTGSASSAAGAASLLSQASSRSAASSGSSSMSTGLMAAQQAQQGSKSVAGAGAAGSAPGAPESAGAAPGAGGAGSVPVDAPPADASADQQASPEPAADGADDGGADDGGADDGGADDGGGNDDGVAVAVPVGDASPFSDPERQPTPLQTSV